MATLKTSLSRSINQTTHNQSLGRTQKHMRQFQVSEQIRRSLNRENIETAFKPLKTLGHVFKKPNDRPTKEHFKGIVNVNVNQKAILMHMELICITYMEYVLFMIPMKE